MDTTLQSLNNRAFHLSEEVYHFLADKYDRFILVPIPDLPLPGGPSRLHANIIESHRQQLRSEEYIKDRIAHSTSGTIDHLHAEVTSSLAAGFGVTAQLPPYAVELLRLSGHLHDSERSFPDRMVRGEEKMRKDPELYRKFKRLHARQSVETVRTIAETAGNISLLEDRSAAFIDDVCALVLRHEIGGERVDGSLVMKPSGVYPKINLNALTDLLRDADSLAYFYANVLTYWEECDRDIESLNNKVHFMFDRMGREAKKLLGEQILFSPDHILGSPEQGDKDLKTIRDALITICT